MLDKLPMIPSVPIVGQINQPVDSIEYIWVEDSIVDPSTSVAGFTAAEIALVNGTLSSQNQIAYRAAQSSLQSASPGNQNSAPTNLYVLLAGHHFIVMLNGSFIIDHFFGSSSLQAQTTTTSTSAAVSKLAVSKVVGIGTSTESVVKQPTVKLLAATNSPPTAVTVDSGSTKASVSKSVGPLSIQNVRVPYI